MGFHSEFLWLQNGFSSRCLNVKSFLHPYNLVELMVVLREGRMETDDWLPEYNPLSQVYWDLPFEFRRHKYCFACENNPNIVNIFDLSSDQAISFVKSHILKLNSAALNMWYKALGQLWFSCKAVKTEPFQQWPATPWLNTVWVKR